MYHVDNWNTLVGIPGSDEQKEEKDAGQNEDEKNEDKQQSNE